MRTQRYDYNIALLLALAVATVVAFVAMLHAILGMHISL